MTAQTATERSRARFARAAYRLPPITLDAPTLAALDLLRGRGDNVADIVRGLIVAAASNFLK